MLSPEEILAQARAQAVTNLPEALLLYQTLLQRVPGHLEASLELGQLLESCHAPREALQLYQKAYRYHPEHPELFLKWQSLTLRQNFEQQLLESPAKVMRSLIKQAQHFPDAMAALAQQASVLFEHHNEIEEARACLRIASQASAPTEAFLLSLRAELLSSLMPSGREEISAYGELLVQALLKHENWAKTLFAEKKLTEDESIHLIESALYLARLGYFNLPELPARQIMGRILTLALPVLESVDAAIKPKLRLGLVLNSNSVVKVSLPPLFKYFPYAQAELHLFYTHPTLMFESVQTEYPQAYHHALPADPWAALRQIQSAQMDLLFLSEVYTDRSFQLLCAVYRLAPVQVTSWLSASSTGLPNIDYFLSHAYLQSPLDTQLFSERIAVLPHFPGLLKRPPCPELPARSAYGLPQTGALYVCPQVLFKLHPDFDKALVAILSQDLSGQLVIQQRPAAPHFLARFLQRIEKLAPELMPRIWVLPEMGYSDYLGLLQLADVLLDPFYFGGGTTSYEALGLGVPLVTWPSERLSGRLSAAFYWYIGVAETIASSQQEYVDLAIKLATAADRNAHLRQRIFDAAEVLFDRAEIAACFWTELLQLSRANKDLAPKEQYE